MIEAVRFAVVFALVVVMLCACGRLSFDSVDTADSSTADPDSLTATCEQSAGLVAYWPFDEGTGSTATDVSRSQLTATLGGNTAWVQGAIGTALQFDGANDLAQLSLTSTFGFAGGTGSFSISYWLSPLSLSNMPDIRGFELAPCAGQGYLLLGIQNDGSVSFGGYDHQLHNAGAGLLPGAVQVGRWTNVVHVLDRSAALGFTYVDGVMSGGTDDLSAWTGLVDCSSSDTGTFGGWNNDFNYRGAIDDVRLYDRVLTAAEALELAQRTTAGCPW